MWWTCSVTFRCSDPKPLFRFHKEEGFLAVRCDPRPRPSGVSVRKSVFHFLIFGAKVYYHYNSPHLTSLTPSPRADAPGITWPSDMSGRIIISWYVDVSLFGGVWMNQQSNQMRAYISSYHHTLIRSLLHIYVTWYVDTLHWASLTLLRFGVRLAHLLSKVFTSLVLDRWTNALCFDCRGLG